MRNALLASHIRQESSPDDPTRRLDDNDIRRPQEIVVVHVPADVVFDSSFTDG